MSGFNSTTGAIALETGQSLINALTGEKLSDLLTEQGEPKLRAAGDAAGEIQEVFYTAADAVSDGRLSWDEIFGEGGIIDQADDVPGALAKIKDAGPQAGE